MNGKNSRTHTIVPIEGKNGNGGLFFCPNHTVKPSKRGESCVN
jgi:hypothetical protein